jgi:FtsH-binding integral membrane protein
MSYTLDYPIAERAPVNVRAAFIRRTYAHLAGAILAFIGLEALLLQVVPGDVVLGMVTNRLTWLVILVAFIGAGFLAQSLAQSNSSPAAQYVGLGLYVVAEAVIFLPLLYIATLFYPDAIPTAGILTLAIFGGLTLTVLVTRSDFSYLYPILAIGTLLAFGFIIAGLIFGFHIGLFFCFAMVALMSGYILYYTSQVLHHYPTDKHVAASLALFASIATLFWYVLQIVMETQRR